MTLTMKRQSWQMWLVVASMVLAPMLVLSAAAMLLWPRDPGTVETMPLVALDDLLVGQAYPVEVMKHFRDAPPLPINWRNSPYFEPPYPVPVLLFRDAAGDVRAFYGRDPRNGCPVVWAGDEHHFIDPCHGSTYTSTGAYVRGPSLRDLDQFGVSIDEDGWIAIDLEDFREGPVQR
jgi:nitrite reductase/ring-hydroxylating ferredoxin subunit